MSRVSRLCPIFRAQPGAYSSGAQKTGVAPPCGSVAGTPSTEAGAPAGGFRRRNEPQAKKKDTCGQFRTESKAASGEAGESQGVVRAPWRTHLPAVRAVWGFDAGVVEKAKIAPLGSEAQIITLFQGKQRGHTQNWREISMANRKIKFPLWLMPETKATVERL